VIEATNQDSVLLEITPPEIMELYLKKEREVMEQLRKRLVRADEHLSIKMALFATEEYLIRKALQRTNGDLKAAAKILEISHRTLLEKIKEYNIVRVCSVVTV